MKKNFLLFALLLIAASAFGQAPEIYDSLYKPQKLQATGYLYKIVGAQDKGIILLPRGKPVNPMAYSDSGAVVFYHGEPLYWTGLAWVPFGSGGGSGSDSVTAVDSTHFNIVPYNGDTTLLVLSGTFQDTITKVWAKIDSIRMRGTVLREFHNGDSTDVADISTGGLGTVTSVDVTGVGALNFTGGPITGSGTIAASFGGGPGDYIDGEGNSQTLNGLYYNDFEIPATRTITLTSDLSFKDNSSAGSGLTIQPGTNTTIIGSPDKSLGYVEVDNNLGNINIWNLPVNMNNQLNGSSSVFTGDVTGSTINAVSGVITPGLQMTTAPSNNYFLKSDASGNASWADITGFIPNDDWKLAGNSLLDTTYFLGTTNNVPFTFRFNNFRTGYFDQQQVILGYHANSKGSQNLIIGTFAGGAGTNPLMANNTIVGNSAAQALTSGSSNVIVGSNAGSLSSGNSNVIVGYNSAGALSTGGSNIVIGVQTAPLMDGSNNIAIGSDAIVGAGVSASSVFGEGARVLQNSSISIGDSTTTPNPKTKVGICTAYPSTTFDVEGDTRFRGNGTPASGKVPTGTDAFGNWTWQTSSGGTGTVTSVGFTGGLISVANATTTPAFTVAGTSGGIPYFSSSSTWASSAALAANALVIGGGAGVAPSTTTTGTGVLTALGVNTGSAGSFVVNGGALGTPSSGTATNLTGLPISTGVSGLASGAATFLATSTSANLRSLLTDESGTGVAYFQGGDIGTPSAGVATNITGLPVSTGISGLGSGIATWLATPTSVNLATALTNETGTGNAVFSANNTQTGVTTMDSIYPKLIRFPQTGGGTQTTSLINFDATGTGTANGIAWGSTRYIYSSASNSININATVTNFSGIIVGNTYQASGAGNTTVTLSSTQATIGKSSSDAVTAVVIGNSNAGSTGAIADFSSSISATALSVGRSGKLTFAGTITAGGTTGDRTINKPTGTVNIAAAGSTVTVTNSLVTTSSIVYAVIRTNDATATGIKSVVPAAGSFVITLNAAATAEVSVGFVVHN